MIDDEPLVNAKQDKLGFRAIADNLASAFLQNDLSRGFVVGVEGAWGSGKSSLVNMALDELEKRQGGPKVIRFAPWLVGSRNELLAQLFADLEPVVLETLPEREKDDTKKILERYAQASSSIAALADLAELAGAPYAGFVAKFLRKSGDKAAELSETSLGELNEKLRGKLELLNRPIVIFVDDLDRLEPSEVAEVLRLVKAVADFPNVAYILAYDLDVIAASVQTALQIPNGKSYLEKVVQASFKVPNAMSFDLRNWLKAEMSKLLNGAKMEAGVESRLEGVYHQWCNEFLETPRDVVRVVNSLKLNFVPVRDKVDPGDMVFLHLVRSKNHNLFNWIERYVSTLSGIGDWGYVAPGADRRFGRELLEVIDKSGEEEIRFIFDLQSHLPGLNRISLTQERNEFKVFSLSSADELKAFMREQRLASPSHFSYYFSFSSPSGNLDDSYVDQFLITCEQQPEKALASFRKLINSQRPQGGRLAEVLIDRIVGLSANISANQVAGLFQVMGEAIDELVPFAKTNSGYVEFLKGNRREIFGLIDQIEVKEARTKTLQNLFTTAKSFAWLASIIRETTFAHGTVGTKGEPKESWLLSEDEFEICKKLFVTRLTETPPAELLNVPHFLKLMFAWYQLGDTDGPRTWIRDQTERDEDFIKVLGAMTSWSESSPGGVNYNIRPETLNSFFEGVNGVKKRLKRITLDNTIAPDVRSAAQKHLDEIEEWPNESGKSDSAL
ncbi:KAP family P-loop domain protein [Roseovarius albus]|uniref:KAP family P-loop domain protein n=1 Tax=Roseovarius albus TaxID=1247867 RepID=A0A1X6YX11_9RHOB|nr:P-loop NTPase fold protein [Roseovarius albus]SLN34250.1 KAP family P-loop domain protein [Roseovarius albus]